jgi:hypothetical protein
MPASMVLLYKEMRQTFQGPVLIVETYAVTGLTANGANTVAFPFTLNTVPRCVSITPVGNGAAGALVSLDTSQGAAAPANTFAGGRLGVDQNNIYLYIGNATQCEITVTYNQS